MKRRFVALDRDGTLIREMHYLSDPDQVQLLPGVLEGLRRMRAQGLGLFVVTNQSGVGRGYFSEQQVWAVHERLASILAVEGITLDGVYYCPHTPADGCDCRKPRPGMLLRAAEELDFTPQECFIVGDKPCDIELGQAVGAVTFLVRTGYGAETEAQTNANYVEDTLPGVAARIALLLKH